MTSDHILRVKGNLNPGPSGVTYFIEVFSILLPDVNMSLFAPCRDCRRSVICAPLLFNWDSLQPI